MRRWPIAVLILAASCDRGGAPTSPPEPESATQPATDATPAVIDADWVASKFEPPPPPAEKDWAREIERDPIAALRQMDPAALQPKGRTKSRTARRPRTSAAQPKREATYDPNAPLRGWPPTVGQPYPSFVLKDQDGVPTAISDFKGKVVLIELVGLTCRACHALAGGNEPGKPRFRGIPPQRNLPSIDRFVQGYAKVSLDHPDIVFVQLVLYGMGGGSAPEEEDVREWAKHFDFRASEGEYVLVGDLRFISPQTRALIPGFHLVDQDGILRALSSNDPRHDPLHSSLLPKLGELVQGG